MSGKLFKFEQRPNKKYMSVTLIKSHLEISGNDFNEELP